jgi:hypothetical protein
MSPQTTLKKEMRVLLEKVEMRKFAGAGAQKSCLIFLPRPLNNKFHRAHYS